MPKLNRCANHSQSDPTPPPPSFSPSVSPPILSPLCHILARPKDFPSSVNTNPNATKLVLRKASWNTRRHSFARINFSTSKLLGCVSNRVTLLGELVDISLPLVNNHPPASHFSPCRAKPHYPMKLPIPPQRLMSIVCVSVLICKNSRVIVNR